MKKAAFHSIILVAIDIATLLLALVVSYRLWIWNDPQLEFVVQVQLWELFWPNPWMPPATLLMIAWMFLNHRSGLYNPGKLESSVHIASTCTRTSFLMLLLLVVVQFLFIQRYFSRLLMLLFLSTGFSWMLIVRLAFFQIQLRLPNPLAAQNVAIFGVGGDALLMAERIEQSGKHAYKLKGYIHPNGASEVKVPMAQVLGEVEDLQEVINHHDLNMVILATRNTPRDEALKLASLCDRMGLKVLQMPFTWGFASPRLAFA